MQLVIKGKRSEFNVEMLDDDEGKEQAEQKSETHEKAEIKTPELSVLLGTCASLLRAVDEH